MKSSTNPNIRIFKTRKYKDINLYLRFSIEYSDSIKQKLALISKIIGDRSKKYPTKVAMTCGRDMLYGISSEINYKCSCNLAYLNMHFIFINPKILNVTYKQYKEFIDEIIYNSIIDKAVLDEAKYTLKAEIMRKLETPNYQANDNFYKIVGKDNPNFLTQTINLDLLKGIDDIDVDDLIKTYFDVINKGQLHIYLCGDISNADSKYLTAFDFSKRKQIKLHPKKCKYTVHTRKIIDKKDIGQSHLSIVFTTPFNKKHKDYFAWFVANGMFGSLPTSLLFSEVREKQSLCYSIYVLDYKLSGIVRIATAIDGKNTNKVIKQVNKMLNRLVNNDFSDELLLTTKTLLINSLDTINDDLDSLVDYYYQNALLGFGYSLQEYKKGIEDVTRKDILRVVKKYKPYFNYCLLGNNNEEILQ